MTTVLILVAFLLGGSAIMGWRGRRLGWAGPGTARYWRGRPCDLP